MKERPILFSAPMVRALLDGRKTQTRRIASKPVRHPDLGNLYAPGALVLEREPRHVIERACPYGKPGDRLWVRETWARDDEDGSFMYRADIGRDMNADAWEQGRLEGVPRYRWRPSIHMPRAASRLTLEVSGVRIERLQEISDADCIAEGTAQHPDGPWHAYRSLWTLINGQASWDANPWVWVVEFRRAA